MLAEYKEAPKYVSLFFLLLRSEIVDRICSVVSEKEGKKKKKKDSWYNDLWNEQLGDRTKFVFSPDSILCGRLGLKHQLTYQVLYSN